MNRGETLLNDTINNCLRSDLIAVAEKHINNPEVIKCANSLKDLIKDISKLKSNEESVAAIVLAKKLIEEESKNN